jgi:hypothetical protein
VQLVWQDAQLKWEWLARRESTVVDTFAVEEGATFERVESPTGRIYLLSSPRTMYWMQDLEEEDEVVAQVNQFLANPQEASPEEQDDALMQAMRANDQVDANQVDALSNILENLGMPQQTSDTPAAAPTGTITLADLQGAMEVATTSSRAAGTYVPLQEVVTPEAIISLLEDEAVRTRLMELLPEEQRSPEHLEENLRSPQVQATLRSLTAAIQPDDVGSMEGYHSLLANFQLDPADGEQALRNGNPIQAFLDCILASVEKEREESKDGEESKEETMEETKDAMEE